MEKQQTFLSGGTPCQSFSIAGLRKGLESDNGNLALEYIRLAERLRPKWLLWENVPGVLSSGGGRDFGAFLGGLAAIGYGFAYRVLDAKNFGVAQRRRRVFVVGHSDYRRAAQVLFEPESMRGDPQAIKKKGQEVAGTLTTGPYNGGRESDDFIASGGGQIWPAHQTCTLNASFGDKMGLEDQHALNGGSMFVPTSFGIQASIIDRHAVALHGTQDPDINFEQAHTLGRNSGQENAVCFSQNASGETRESVNISGTITRATRASHRTSLLRQDSAVRRLTPVECERLQGFPDNHTQIPYRNKEAENCPDGPRYKALGNSMAVPVIRWIGERMEHVNGLIRNDEEQTLYAEVAKIKKKQTKQIKIDAGRA